MSKNWLESSISPGKVSNTVSGAVLTAAGSILFVAEWAGFPLTQGELVELASGLGIAAGLLWALWGAIMKLVARL